ncbi:MAG: DUF4861 family protein [Verrucomicrobiota bacterium]
MKTILAISAAALLPAGAAPVTITSTNKLPLARASQTIELSAAQLAPLDAKDLTTVHVKDAAGKELICQAVDTDGDAYCKPDIVIFQADFAANEAKTFTATAGAKQVYTKEQYKAFGRCVRERFDDFAWENDRIAHRTYGKALETWEGEPLSSSTIDIWSKRTPRMVINDWYLADHYHDDTGEGADFYSAGAARGCGGNGLWADDRLWTSGNYIKSRVLANGPIRVMFELTYDAFNVNGISVTEVKRVTLDAGSQLDHFQSFYKQFTRPGQTQKLTTAIGLKIISGEQKEVNAEQGWLLKWEKVAKDNGNQGLAIIVDPKLWQKDTADKLNQLVLANTVDDATSYWAGFCWDKAGHITSAPAWRQYVVEFAQGLASPLETSVQTASK